MHGPARHYIPRFMERLLSTLARRMDDLASCGTAHAGESKAPYATYITDADWKITHVSTGFTLLTGLEPQEVLGRTPAEVIAPEQGAGPILAQAAHDRLSVGCLLKRKGRLLRRDGSRVAVRVCDTPLFDEEGRMMNVIGEITCADSV